MTLTLSPHGKVSTMEQLCGSDTKLGISAEQRHLRNTWNAPKTQKIVVSISCCIALVQTATSRKSSEYPKGARA